MKCWRTIALWVALALTPALATAQTPPAPPAATPPDATDPDTRVDALQPDFTVTALPTTLRMPRHKLAFRVTHRFGRPLGSGDFGDLVSDFFGFDSGAQIGLDAFATLEGANNLRDRYQSALGVVVSRKAGGRLALYAEPFIVVNANASSGQGWDNNTLALGFGARARLRSAMYAVAEITPRLSGYDPGVSQISFGLEGRAGGHQFQINVSNGAGTTLGQIATGAGSHDNWFLGFNMSRKFF